MLKTSLIACFIAMLVACAPSANIAQTGAADVLEFTLPPKPIEARWIVAVPDFEVRACNVKIGEADLSQEGANFYKELGSGVADIFVTELFRSEQFRITERAELDKVISEQNLSTSGRVDSATAAEMGRITGAELIVLGSLSEFGIASTGGGGKLLGVFGGSSETVTARVTVDIRLSTPTPRKSWPSAARRARSRSPTCSSTSATSCGRFGPGAAAPPSSISPCVTPSAARSTKRRRACPTSLKASSGIHKLCGYPLQAGC